MSENQDPYVIFTKNISTDGYKGHEITLIRLKDNEIALSKLKRILQKYDNSTLHPECIFTLYDDTEELRDAKFVEQLSTMKGTDGISVISGILDIPNDYSINPEDSGHDFYITKFERQ